MARSATTSNGGDNLATAVALDARCGKVWLQQQQQQISLGYQCGQRRREELVASGGGNIINSRKSVSLNVPRGMQQEQAASSSALRKFNSVPQKFENFVNKTLRCALCCRPEARRSRAVRGETRQDCAGPLAIAKKKAKDEYASYSVHPS